jgi:hypothetical protein
MAVKLLMGEEVGITPGPEQDAVGSARDEVGVARDAVGSAQGMGIIVAVVTLLVGE